MYCYSPSGCRINRVAFQEIPPVRLPEIDDTRETPQRHLTKCMLQ